jgi:hypothetical protein
MPEPMRVFVGTDDSQLVATKVLEYSIRKHASGPVEFTSMTAAGMPVPKEKKNRPRTGFSFCRFTIPERCGHRGRALYLDADMLVFTDIAELWRIPFGEQSLLCTWQKGPPPAWRDNAAFHSGRHYAVMLLECERLGWDIREVIRGLDENRYTYQQLMYDLCIVRPESIDHRVPAEWNSLEFYEAGCTKNIHYTVVPTQPWKCRTNPCGAIWDEYLAEAVAAGVVTRQDLELGVAKNYLHQDLLRFAPGASATAIAPLPAEQQNSPALASAVPRKRGLLFFVQLVTDCDLLVPLVLEAQRRHGVEARVLVDAGLLAKFPHVAVQLEARGLAFGIIGIEALRAGTVPDWCGIDAVVTATESSARPHAAARRLTVLAQQRGLPAFTLQHGFENIGLTWFDHLHTPANTTFCSDRILAWGPLGLLHPEASAATRARCVPVGCFKEVPAPQGRFQKPAGRPHMVVVFENLHWHRYDDAFRERFVRDLAAAARATTDTTWLVRPHPSGVWLTGRYRGQLPQAPNLVIAAPRDPEWDGWNGSEVLALADLVLTTPSTVALDAARLGRPTGVIAYDLDVRCYAPLPLVKAAADWTGLAQQSHTVDGRKALAARSVAFVERVLVPGDAAARAIDLVLQGVSQPRAVGAAQRLVAVVRRAGCAVRNRLFGVRAAGTGTG